MPVEGRSKSLEPVAAEMLEEPEGTIMECLTLSLCISAKRQANALEKIEGHLANLAGELAHPEWGVAPSIRRATKS